MMLRDIAHVRAGDKGDCSLISVIAYEARRYTLLAEAVTADHVRRHLAGLCLRSVRRFELPALGALHFVLEGALEGGVTRSLALDAHGKTLATQLLDLIIDKEG